MEIRSFFTVVVVEINMFESSIVDERHFGNREEAECFRRSLPQEYSALVSEICM